MTDDPDQRTAIDLAIDEVACAMTRDRVPDLRAGVRSGLDHRRPRVAWWQPAFAAAAIVLIVAVTTWRMTDAPSEHPRDPIVGAPRPPDTIAAGPAPKIPLESRPTMPRMVRRIRPPRTSDVDLVGDIPTLPAVSVDPLRIEAMVTDPPVDTEVEWFAPLVVESISVEPLPRSDQ